MGKGSIAAYSKCSMKGRDMKKTCFVIMPIGDQTYEKNTITEIELKKRYDDLIKEALLRADNRLQITRADEISKPGSITTDILSRIMHSDIVVADVTYPNPNVFYELGLRHACRPGTLIIREKTGPKSPFDISHLRHIPYENTPTGLKNLGDEISKFLIHLDTNPGEPDNHLLELAKLTGYEFMTFGKNENRVDEAKMDLLVSMLGSPELMKMAVRKSQGEDIEPADIIHAMTQNPDASATMLKALVRSGAISLNDMKLKSDPKPPR